jgi:hypothetical protein
VNTTMLGALISPPVVCPKGWHWLKKGEVVTGGCGYFVRNSDGIPVWRYFQPYIGQTILAPEDNVFLEINA